MLALGVALASLYSSHQASSAADVLAYAREVADLHTRIPDRAKSLVNSGALPPCHLAGYSETLLVSLTRIRGTVRLRKLT